MNSYRTISEEQLTNLFRQGNHEAFHILVEKHQDRLINFLTRICGNYDTACDLAQETFLRAFLRCDRYEPTHAFSTWLYRIATNLCINHLRRRRLVEFFSIHAERKGTDGITYEDALASQRLDPESELTREEDITIVQKALKQVPVKYRVPLVLREIEEMEYQEIGDVLQIAPGTVKSRIFRGREELRKRLQKMHQQELKRMQKK